MNKLVKLPLFLGVTGAACAVILAGVYSFTHPIVEAAKLEKQNAAYISMYSAAGYEITGADVVEVYDISDELAAAGCTTKVTIEKANGACYTCEVKGYAGTVSFQIAFADGKYIGYTDISNGETAGFGKTLIENMAGGLMNGVDANQSILGYSAYTTAMSGKSTTGKPLGTAIDACRADYLANVIGG